MVLRASLVCFIVSCPLLVSSFTVLSLPPIGLKGHTLSSSKSSSSSCFFSFKVESTGSDEGPSSNGSNNNDSRLPPTTTAAQERRDESKRREERRNDVVIGRSSAIPGESDYALDISLTEQQWMRQATAVEQEVYHQTEQGMQSLKLLNLEQAAMAFDRVFELKPQAYLWQAGLVKYYLQDWQDAAEILASSATQFESRFGEPATEERIWRNACELKVASSVGKQERKRLEAIHPGGIAAQVAQIKPNTMTTATTTAIDNNENDENNNSNNNENRQVMAVQQQQQERQQERLFLATERRRVLKLARELFDASVQKDWGQVVVCRAHLRTLCGPIQEQQQQKRRRRVWDPKMWKLQAWFYLGLHYDASGEDETSQKCMKMALRLCRSSSTASDLLHTLPLLHMATRDWFDDDDDLDSNLFADQDEKTSHRLSALVAVGEDNNNNEHDEDGVATIFSAEARDRMIQADPVFVTVLVQGIDKMIVEELKDVLQKRGTRAMGSKEELRAKVLETLILQEVAPR